MAYRRIVFAFMLMAAALYVLPARAVELGPADVVDGDFLARERVVNLKGIVRHNAFIVGKAVTLGGNIGGDALVVADTVHVTGAVDGNLYVVARELSVDGVVSKNIMAAVMDLTLGKNGRVGWDISTAARSMAISGTVDGSLFAAAGMLTLDGVVRKDVRAHLPRGGVFLVGEHANVAGDINFISPTEGLTVDQNAQVQGRITHDPRLRSFAGGVIADLLFLLGLAVVGAGAMLLPIPLLVDTSGFALSESARCLITGLLAVVIAAIIIPLVALTGVGLGLGFVLAFALLILLYLGTLVGGYALGVGALHYFNRPLPPFSTLVVGLLIYAVAMLVPIIGPLTRIAVALAGLGAMVLKIQRWYETSTSGQTG